MTIMTGPEAMVTFGGAELAARVAGTLWWPERQVLAVADMHLGRSERLARQGHTLLPPYETLDTLARLEAEVAALAPRVVISLGDSFDDLPAAGGLGEEVVTRLARMAAGRRLIWIAGNHDPGPLDLPGTYLEEAEIGGITFRHIAEVETRRPEVSAHFHPKVRLMLRGRTISRKCFAMSGTRLILPAFGAYTGGLDVRDRALRDLIGPDATTLVLDREVVALPLARLG
ncbi:MAG: ligase-associated DNA damage response endonuclease PdeM [Pseudomonadota bacterium]